MADEDRDNWRISWPANIESVNIWGGRGRVGERHSDLQPLSAVSLSGSESLAMLRSLAPSYLEAQSGCELET